MSIGKQKWIPETAQSLNFKKNSENATIFYISRTLYHYWINNVLSTNRKQSPSLCRGKRQQPLCLPWSFLLELLLFAAKAVEILKGQENSLSVLVPTEVLCVTNMRRASPFTLLDYQKHFPLSPSQSWHWKLKSAVATESFAKSSSSAARDGNIWEGPGQLKKGRQRPESPSRKSRALLMPS